MIAYDSQIVDCTMMIASALGKRCWSMIRAGLAPIARAAVTDIRAGKVVEGASTISMQLARILFLSRERTWRRKIEEAFVAVELEKNYSKSQILTLYLDLVNLGHGNYGVEAASRYYFDKPAAKLARDAIQAGEKTEREVQDALEQARLKLQVAEADSAAARDTFNQWIATRRATEGAGVPTRSTRAAHGRRRPSPRR